MTREELVSEFDDALYTAMDAYNTEEERQEALCYARKLFDIALNDEYK